MTRRGGRERGAGDMPSCSRVAELRVLLLEAMLLLEAIARARQALPRALSERQARAGMPSYVCAVLEAMYSTSEASALPEPGGTGASAGMPSCESEVLHASTSEAGARCAGEAGASGDAYSCVSVLLKRRYIKHEPQASATQARCRAGRGRRERGDAKS
jgi:hypothetical protein